MSFSPLLASAMIGLSATTNTSTTPLPSPQELILGSLFQDDAAAEEAEEKSPWSGSIGAFGDSGGSST